MSEESKGLTEDSFESMLDDFDDSDNSVAAEESDATPVEVEPQEDNFSEEEVTDVVAEPPVEVPQEAEEVAPPTEVPVEEPVVPVVPVDNDVASSEYTYVVQKGFTQEGRTFRPGEVIPVKCRYCSFWEKEWLGAVRCKPGKTLDEAGNKMSVDIFSCESFFICKELEPELDAFLSMDLSEVLTVRRMLPSMKKLLDTEAWLNDMVDKKGMDVDKIQVFASSKGFVTSFTSTEQLVLAEQFLRTYARKLSAKDKAKMPPKLKFESGDWVEWVDLTTKAVIKGIVISKGRGQIKVAATEGASAGHSWSFNFKEWTAKRSPKITRKSVHEDER